MDVASITAHSLTHVDTRIWATLLLQRSSLSLLFQPTHNINFLECGEVLCSNSLCRDFLSDLADSSSGTTQHSHQDHSQWQQLQAMCPVHFSCQLTEDLGHNCQLSCRLYLLQTEPTAPELRLPQCVCSGTSVCQQLPHC